VRLRISWLLALLASACSLATGPAEEPESSRQLGEAGFLASEEQIEGSFLLRQKISVEHPQGGVSFEAVLQASCGKLTVIAFAPFGAKAFVLRQSGETVEFQPFLDQELPFPPRYILYDINRVFFYPDAPSAPEDGDRIREYRGESVRERWQGGRLVERRFRPASGKAGGELIVRYQGELPGSDLSRKVEFENQLHGYRLSISNLSYQELSCRESRGE
jgi:hypothetical protein